MEEQAVRGREEEEVMLGAVGFGGGGKKGHGGTGGEKQELHPGFALLSLPRLLVKQQWENSAEAALGKRRRAAYGREKVTKGSWRCVITIMIC